MGIYAAGGRMEKRGIDRWKRSRTQSCSLPASFAQTGGDRRISRLLWKTPAFAGIRPAPKLPGRESAQSFRIAAAEKRRFPWDGTVDDFAGNRSDNTS